MRKKTWSEYLFNKLEFFLPWLILSSCIWNGVSNLSVRLKPKGKFSLKRFLCSYLWVGRQRVSSNVFSISFHFLVIQSRILCYILYNTVLLLITNPSCCKNNWFNTWNTLYLLEPCQVFPTDPQSIKLKSNISHNTSSSILEYRMIRRVELQLLKQGLLKCYKKYHQD